jgi:hypothetical protein
MKRQVTSMILTMLCLVLAVGVSLNRDAVAQRAASQEKITVLNPLGTPPPVQLLSMAPRLDSLDGKTIYIVDDGFVGGDNLLLEMVDWFEQNYPNTRTLFKRKGGGGFEAEDPKLWAEIRENASAVIIGMGH